ncbi:MAG: alpha/beta hydrolase [Phycisphaerae bacterium]|nr:alpha/beta hydrolase [Phycisphaerae bacterium]
MGWTAIMVLGAWIGWEFIVRNWAMMSIIATVVAMVAIPALVLSRYIRIMLNILKDTPPPLSMGPLDFDRMEGQIVRFRSFDGTSLRGMFLFGDPSQGYKGTILFCHEFASDMYSCVRYTRSLLEAGFDVFSFDFRGHGDSSHQEDYQPRQWVSDREVDDVHGAIAFLEDYLESQGRPADLGIFGISRGAAAAIIASMRNPAVKAIVTDGLFSTDATLEMLMKRWACIFAKVRFVYENHPDAFWKFLRWVLFICAHWKFRCRYPSVRRALKKMTPRPILMIHGDRDSYIPTDLARVLYRIAPDPKSLWVVPLAKHNQAVVVDPAEYRARTVEFFEHRLYGQPTGEASQRPIAQGA